MISPHNRRPDPDALLTLTHNQQKGELKVFLGAAPGVGKTYAMLEGAHRLKSEGVDVVIGLVETHNRKETLALIDGLEIIPRKKNKYLEKEYEEFDIDAALQRHPRLIIVDELAHTNSSGCRHPKRWQDVQELLDAGIHVWTAVNIQHLESLADVVTKVTGIIVRETVPDTIIQNATQIVLVDIPPVELIERLKSGKIYMAETARRAIDNFFTIKNLTALRELALRRTADRVDSEIINFIKQKAINGTVNLSEKLIVCINELPSSEALIRKACQLALALNASWIVVNFRSHNDLDIDLNKESKINDLLQLASRLGAETRRLISQDYINDLFNLVYSENATQILIGKVHKPFLSRIFNRSFAEHAIDHAKDITVNIIPLDYDPDFTFINFKVISKKLNINLKEIGFAIFLVACAVLAGELITHFIKLPNLSMIFLSAVLFCAIKFGTRSALIASALSFLSYNFFFIEPIYSFTIAEPHELFALLIFLCVAFFTGSLAGRVKDQSESATKRARQIENLYNFSRKLSDARKPDDILWVAAAELQKIVTGKSVMLRPIDGHLETIIIWPPEIELDTSERMAARWAFEKSEVAGCRTNTLPDVKFYFIPLITPRGTIGVAGYYPNNDLTLISSETRRNIEAILELTATSLDRALLEKEALKAVELEQNEVIRNALLTSLSHDLRTPLASITGAASSLRELGQNLNESNKDELLASIEQEAARLSGFISNLLDMSRIESGALKVKHDLIDVRDIIHSVIARAHRVFSKDIIKLNLASTISFIRGDGQLLEQVLFNLIDNAHKYGQGSDIIIHARDDGKYVLISVTDEGNGIKSSDLKFIFDKFYRGGKYDGRLAGTGLGLSICKGLIEAMEGTIEAQSPAIRRRGTRLIVKIPIANL